MPSRESQQTRTVPNVLRACRKRIQSVLRHRLGTNACLVVALMLRASLLCMVCAGEASDGFCSQGLAAGEFDAIASVKQLARAGHRCCGQGPQSRSGPPGERSSNPDEKNQCCLLDFHTSSQAALLGVFDHRTIVSNQAPQRDAIETSLQSTGSTWRSSATSRPSTHLLCCVFLI